MTKRSTFSVSDFRDQTNTALALSAAMDKPDDPQATPAYRMGLYLALEAVLHATGNYNGFRFLDGHEAVARDEHDDTARHYF